MIAYLPPKEFDMYGRRWREVVPAGLTPWRWEPSVGQLLGLRLALHDHLIASGWKAWE